MTALSKDRPTPRRERGSYSDPVGANVRVFSGALIVLNAAGYAVPGTTATGLRARGIAEHGSNNLGGANGAARIKSRTGVHRLMNDGSINRTHITGTAYIVDDQTVAATDGTGTRSAAGRIDDVDDQGVWVYFQ